MNTKISEFENKIPNTSCLVTTTVLNTKISEIENKIAENSNYITTQEFNKLTETTKHLEVQKKLISLIIKDYNFFLDRTYFRSNDGSQSTFVYQPTLYTLELNKDKGTDYILSCKSKRAFNSKLNPSYTVFLHSTNLSGYRMGIKFDKDPLAVEQNNYLCKLQMFTLSMI